MEIEFSGIERRLDELVERLARLRALQEEPRSAFDADPFLRDIAERNLEVAAQCCIDLANRIIALEHARKPIDYHDAILRMGELDVLSPESAQALAPIAGFRNALVHYYVSLDWDKVFANLQHLEELEHFSEAVHSWLRARLER